MREKQISTDSAIGFFHYYWLAFVVGFCLLAVVAAIAWWMKRCSLYQSIQARAQLRDQQNAVGSTSSLELSTTGHDRFCQINPSINNRRRKKRLNSHRRTQSASEFNVENLPSTSNSSIRSIKKLSSFRSASLDDETADERTCLKANATTSAVSKSETRIELKSRLPNIVRLFSCVSLSTYAASNSNPNANKASVTTDRQGMLRYEYTALDDGYTQHEQQEQLELERKAQRSFARDKAYSSCQAYLHTSNRYVFKEQLNDIGSRVDKHWFVVNDNSIKTERLLALVPQNANSPIEFTTEIREALQELFLALQHPYIYPVLDVDFQPLAGQTYIISVLPLNVKGCLKDVIYKSKWQDDWSVKYGERSSGLPLSQVQRLGRQILEALLFLKDRGFPPYGHLHSGNIVLQNGVARLTGFENTLLGYTSRIHPIIWGKLKSNPNSIDTICFGHVLFEMSAGYELCTPHPTPSHMLDIQDYPQIQKVLEFIFQNPNGRYPSIEEISLCEFFRNIDLRELRSLTLPQSFRARLTPNLLTLLNDVKNHHSKKSSRTGADNRNHLFSLSDSRRSKSLTDSSDDEDDEILSRIERSSDSEIADDEQSDFSPIKEHRNLSLQIGKKLIEHNFKKENCLTRRIPSLS